MLGELRASVREVGFFEVTGVMLSETLYKCLDPI
jgi:hypothetical protein